VVLFIKLILYFNSLHYLLIIKFMLENYVIIILIFLIVIELLLVVLRELYNHRNNLNNTQN
jgi:hypothetical protein